MTQLWLTAPPVWFSVSKVDPRAAALADRHYSRQSVGDPQFMPPGETLVLLHEDNGGAAVWGVCLNLDPAGELRWRCSIFRNEGRMLSSYLVAEATTLTRWSWRAAPPPVPLRTEIDPGKVRKKRDPGRCFLKAGWRHVGWRPAGHGRPLLRILEAP